MSWDVMLIKLDALPKEDAEPEPLPMGHPAIVGRRISKAWPGTIWRGVEGHVEQGECVFEIEVSVDDVPDNATTVHVRVRGEGEPLPFLRALCESNAWFAFDAQAGEFLDLDATTVASWAAFRVDRDAVAVADGKRPRKKRDSHRKMLAVRRARSREIVFYNLDGPARVGPDGYFARNPIGEATAIRESLERVLPRIEWHLRGGTFDDGATSLELRLPSQGTLDELGCAVSGPRANEIIETLARAHGWAAWDSTDGGFCWIAEEHRHSDQGPSLAPSMSDDALAKIRGGGTIGKLLTLSKKDG